ncbi:MAG: glucuronate isomerase [Clostridia bacterium]
MPGIYWNREDKEDKVVVNTQNAGNIVRKALRDVKVLDVHTHLFPKEFNGLMLYGIDELLTYHYLVAETMRHSEIPYEDFWNMGKPEQADMVHRVLFKENIPCSEATRGVLTTLQKLLIRDMQDLKEARSYFSHMTPDEYTDVVFRISNISQVVMTNDPFDRTERAVWTKRGENDPRFLGALRLDGLLNAFPECIGEFEGMGYQVSRRLDVSDIKEIRRFLRDWIFLTDACYMAVSLPPDFDILDGSPRSVIITECVLPVSRESNKPFAMMIGVKKLVNPYLRLAGDSVGKASIENLEHICSTYPKNKFMVTMLSRENQHECCVVARKFRNLFLFGCWWFLNNPGLIREITTMRMEMLGNSFLPQHSDARVMDQLIYKWDHTKAILGDVLTEQYIKVLETGWGMEEWEVVRDVERLMGGNFTAFIGMNL